MQMGNEKEQQWEGDICLTQLTWITFPLSPLFSTRKKMIYIYIWVKWIRCLISTSIVSCFNISLSIIFSELTCLYINENTAFFLKGENKVIPKKKG